MHALALAAIVALMMAGCAAGGGAGPTPTSALPTATPTPTPGLPGSGPVPAEMFGAMVEQAADEADVDRSAVEVVRAESVTWRDGSMGCPEPGMMYTQALVPGYLVVLSAGGQEYRFHADRGSRFVLCPAGRAEDPAPGDNT